MFLLNGTPLPPDQPFEHDGVQYPSNWLRLASQEEKAAIGITEQPDPVRPDDRFYWVDGNNQGTPKDLNELKAQWTKQVDQIAYSLLLPTDWMIVRKAETNVEVPADALNHRTAVRAAAVANRTAIANAADFEAFLTVVGNLTWPETQNGN
jgi:hypothetical protein